jgi:glutathione S-transferase
MLKLIIGNKAYSSWSLRGWLAVKQSGLPFEEITVPMFDEDWDERREGDEFAPSGGKVPILWDDETVVWDSLAIIEWLADKTDRAATGRRTTRPRHGALDGGRDAFELRESAPRMPDERAQAASRRARAVGGGQGRDQPHPGAVGAGPRPPRRRRPYLFGDFGAADIMFAPVVTRFVTYSSRCRRSPADRRQPDRLRHREGPAECVGEQLQRTLSPRPAGELGRVARARARDPDPSRLTLDDLLRAASEMRDPRVAIEVAKAAGRCNLAPMGFAPAKYEMRSQPELIRRASREAACRCRYSHRPRWPTTPEPAGAAAPSSSTSTAHDQGRRASELAAPGSRFARSSAAPERRYQRPFASSSLLRHCPPSSAYRSRRPCRQADLLPSVTPASGAVFDVLDEALSRSASPSTASPSARRPTARPRTWSRSAARPGPHFGFAGHLDVVPAGEGWSGDPSTARIEDGRLIGRGANDMKSAIAAFVAAVSRVEQQSGHPVLLITGDEEGYATYGTPRIIDWLNERAIRPDMILIGEPTGETGSATRSRSAAAARSTCGSTCRARRATSPTRTAPTIRCPAGADRGRARRAPPRRRHRGLPAVQPRVHRRSARRPASNVIPGDAAPRSSTSASTTCSAARLVELVEESRTAGAHARRRCEVAPHLGRGVPDPAGQALRPRHRGDPAETGIEPGAVDQRRHVGRPLPDRSARWSTSACPTRPCTSSGGGDIERWRGSTAGVRGRFGKVTGR